MKTVEEPNLKADPVMVEVRRAKVALAEKYDFDVVAMVRALRERDQKDNSRLNNPPPATGGDGGADAEA